MLAQRAEVLDAVPGDVERDRRRHAGMAVHLGCILELLVRVARHAGLGEDGEAGAGVAVRPRRRLDLLCAKSRFDLLDIDLARIKLLGQ